jgi:hypothetical protein
MPLDLFYRWNEFNRVQPFTPERADMRMASIGLMVARIGGWKTAKAEDFIYSDAGKRKAGKQRGGMSAEAMKEALFGQTIREAQRMGIDPSTLYGKAGNSECKRIRPSPNESVPTGDEAGAEDRP